jgi:lysozyme
LKYHGAWKLWQQTDVGKVDGIKGDVDFDIYNGSMYDLQKFTIPDNFEDNN